MDLDTTLHGSYNVASALCSRNTQMMRNQNFNRRTFLSLTGAGIAGVAGGPWLGAAAAAEAQDADLVVFNAKVYTVDSRAPKAEAFAVKAGRFAAVGSTADMKALIGKGTQTFDAKQMTIVPGFIDCHNHAPGNVLLYEVLVGNPYVVEFVTIASIVDKLRAKARETPPGTWVEGLFLRRHQGEGQSPAQRSRPRPGIEGPSGGGASSRRPHLVLQQQGARDGGHQQEHAQSARRNLRPRRQRRTQRPRYRPRDGRPQPRRQAADLYRRSRRCSATATGWPTSPSSSCATA